MAIQIEKNGAAFYRKETSLQENELNLKFLETNAYMEDRYQAGFEEMKRTLSDMGKTQTVFDPKNEMALYLKSMAQIIETAISLEKESILF